MAEVGLRVGATRKPEFRDINPIGRVPTLELEPGVFLAESNAILWYFAEGTPFIPSGKLERAHAPVDVLRAIQPRALCHRGPRVAEEGRFELGRYPAIRAWFERVQAQPRHIRITEPAPAAR